MSTMGIELEGSERVGAHIGEEPLLLQGSLQVYPVLDDPGDCLCLQVPGSLPHQLVHGYLCDAPKSTTNLALTIVK